MTEQTLIQYAPYIVIIIAFLVQYKIFVTPAEFKEALEKKADIEIIESKLEKYVLKELFELAISQQKEDIADMKDKIDKIYDKIMNV